MEEPINNIPAKKFFSNEGIPLPARHTFNKSARLALYDLIRYTPMNIRENRRKGCRTFYYGTQYFKRPGKRGLRIFAYRTVCNKTTYTTQIGFVDWRKGLKSSIWVHCTCDYFKYNVEYVLTQLGASELVFSWNQPPHVRNPDFAPHACKHILTVVDDALVKSKMFGKKDLEVELQNVEIEEIELTKFEQRQLEDRNRFKNLKEKQNLQQPAKFSPYSDRFKDQEITPPETPKEEPLKTGEISDETKEDIPTPEFLNPPPLDSPFSSIPRQSKE
jgi:hypothetical protein